MKALPYFVGPNGDVITIADLPSPTGTRWTIRRKSEVVLAVQAGLLSLGDACIRYRLTLEEFSSWQRAIEKRGWSCATRRETDGCTNTAVELPQHG
jgi:hypothetical protein